VGYFLLGTSSFPSSPFSLCRVLTTAIGLPRHFWPHMAWNADRDAVRIHEFLGEESMTDANRATWCTQGRPYYASYSDDQTIAYISDIGAQGLKPLFITCGTVVCSSPLNCHDSKTNILQMAVFLDLSFVSERWLRHKGRLAKNKTGTEKVLTILSFFFAAVGSAGIILLSIFDTLNHPSLHRIFLLLFIAGYLLSAIFICWEYQRLGIRKFSMLMSQCLINTCQTTGSIVSCVYHSG
jgi:hypothetical protein